MARKKTLQLVDTQLHNLSSKIAEMADFQVEKACSDLDILLQEIGKHIQSEMPSSTLEYFILELANSLYFAVGKQEEMGIKEDVAKLIRQDMYSEIKRDTQGTVAEKEANAILNSKEEELVQIIYSRAYKRVKHKVDAGYEMLNALKKIMNARLAEIELSQSRYIGGQKDEFRRNNQRPE